MQNISGFGLVVNITASTTFPNGLQITAFADDSDPMDFSEQTVTENAMGLNGHHIVWSRANPLEMVINVIPRTEDDTNLSILFEANRVGLGKRGARDVVTLTATYPDGSIVVCSGGIVKAGTPSVGVAASARMKTRPYRFSFENIVKANQ